jgi:hypothetical protein
MREGKVTPLSAHLSAEAFCATAQRDLAERNLSTFLATPDLVASAALLAATVWEPFLDLAGGANATSGYRCSELNARVGGSRPPLGTLSAHVFGRAIDCVPRCPLLEAMELLAISAIPYDKAIVEGVGGARWLHLQSARPQTVRRRLLLVTYGDRDERGALVYSDFDPQDPRARVFA